MGRNTDIGRRWDAAVADLVPSEEDRDPIVDRDFDLDTETGPVRFRVCSRRTDGTLHCLQAPATTAIIPEELLNAALAAGTVRRT